MVAGIRSIPEILQDVLSNIQDIVRAEVRLAKAELGEELNRARAGGLLIGVGAVAAIFSALFHIAGLRVCARSLHAELGCGTHSRGGSRCRGCGDTGPRLEAFQNYPGGA